MPPSYQIAYALALALTCGFTFWAGGRTERIGLAIVIVASLASYPATVLIHPRWRQEMLGTAAIDAATTIAFFVLMVRSRAFWPVWSLGFCLAMMTAHAMRCIQHAVPAWSYYDTTSLWAYPVMAAIVVGAAFHRWRRPTISF